jgi:tRNA(Leu) C34 or U34 (ribose-2'-O)-methylase TrmL
MAKLSTDLRSGVLHPREAIFSTANLGSLNAETIIVADGCATVTLDLRGTFSLTMEVSGTVDGANWTLIPMRPVNQASVLYVAAVVGTAAGTWVGQCAGFRQVRARVTAYTSGSATTTLAANNAQYDNLMFGPVTSSIVTAVGAAAAAVTLTIPSPGAGLRNYMTYLAINRFAAAALTAAAAPVTVTTTNLPGALAFSFAAEAFPQGSLDRWREDFAFPVASSAQGTATTIVCPATPNVIWRATAGFYVAP